MREVELNGSLEEGEQSKDVSSIQLINEKVSASLRFPTITELEKIIVEKKFLIAQAAVEFSVMLAIFLVAFFIYKAKAFVAIIPVNTTCDGDETTLRALNVQGGANTMGLNYVLKQQSSQSYYSNVYLKAQWSSCTIANPALFTPSTNSILSQSFILQVSPNQTSLYAEGQKTALNVTLPTQTKQCKTNPDGSKSCTPLSTYPNPSCFQLLCSATTYPGNYANYGQPLIFASGAVVSDVYNVTAELFGIISIDTDYSVSAACYTYVSNNAIPYFSTSNTVLESPVKQCTTYPSDIDSIGIGLSYFLTAASLIKTFHMFRELITAQVVK